MRRIAYAKEAFDTYNHPEKRTISDARENFTAIVRQVAANTHCAGYIVVARSVGSYPGTNQSLTGIGVVTHGPLGRATVFDYFRVAVLDGQTFAIRDDPFGSFGARLSTALSRYVKDEFLRPIEGAEFLASPEAAAKDAKLRDAMRALVAERLDMILPEHLKE